MRLYTWIFLLVGVAVLDSGCANTEEGSRRTQPRRQGFTEVDIQRASPQGDIRTIQLYREQDEAARPIVGIQSGQQLTLEFDVLAPGGRPLSVYFYHMNRYWEQDYLQPVEYLTSFQSDNLNDYQISLGTEVPYVHYTYRFPNNNIQFRMSGNYMLRVTEQGDEQAILFEEPFLLTEQSAEVQFGVQSVLGEGTGTLIGQPVLRFQPPTDLSANVFDFHACFVRNMQFSGARCPDQSRLDEPPFMQFYLERYAGFEPLSNYHVLDLSRLETGSQIIRVEYGTSPFQAKLTRDQADLGSLLDNVQQYEQPVVTAAVQALDDADTRGEYVDVQFSLAPPDEIPYGGGVLLTGSFNGWRLDPAYQLAWNDTTKQYEGTALIKQGIYEYQYRQIGARRRSQGVFNPPTLYTALLYFYDPARNTDRLLAVSSTLSR